MKFLKDLWKAFDGNKAILGGICMFTAVFIDKVLLDIWGVSFPQLPMIQETCEYLGGLLFGTGIAHKVIKARNGKVAPK